MWSSVEPFSTRKGMPKGVCSHERYAIIRYSNRFSSANSQITVSLNLVVQARP
jgi:hypothetical protein